MTGVHLHLLVNHAPIFGALFAVLLLAASYVWAPSTLRRTALIVLVGTGIAGALANFTGEPAERAVRGLPGVKREVIHEHEEWGEKSFILATAVGVIALGALVRWRHAPIPAGVAGLALVLAAVVFGTMAWTGLLGGRVRHTEVRPGATKEDATIIEPPRVRRPPGEP